MGGAGQTPDFDEFTVVLSDRLRLTSAGGELDVTAGRAGLVAAGEWVRYSMPDPEGAEYAAVCLPVFASSLAHRDHD